jgi:hypothetical protein
MRHPGSYQQNDVKMPPMTISKEIWIGMLEVRPRMDAKVIAEATGAFVNVITWADDCKDFYRKATELMITCIWKLFLSKILNH